MNIIAHLILHGSVQLRCISF